MRKDMKVETILLSLVSRVILSNVLLSFQKRSTCTAKKLDFIYREYYQSRIMLHIIYTQDNTFEMQSVVSVVVVFKRLCVYYKLFSNCKLNFDYPFQFISYTITITFIIILFYLSFSVLYAKLCTLYKRLNGWN